MAHKIVVQDGVVLYTSSDPLAVDVDFTIAGNLNLGTQLGGGRIEASSGSDLYLTTSDGGSINLEIPSTGTLTINGVTGTAGQVFTSAGPGLPPTWQAAGGSSLPLNEIGFGDGSAIISSPNFRYFTSTNAFYVNVPSVNNAGGEVIIRSARNTSGFGQSQILLTTAPGANLASAVVVTAGANTGTGNGGGIGVTAGSSVTGTGGQIDITSGNGANGGDQYLIAGAGTTGFGGLMFISGGLTTSATQNGGDVIIRAGANNTDSALSGSIRLRTNNTDQFVVTHLGTLLVGGDAGTVGEVLTSSGANSPPTWSPIPTIYTQNEYPLDEGLQIDPTVGIAFLYTRFTQPSPGVALYEPAPLVAYSTTDPVLAGGFVPGWWYTIVSVGSTDFTAIGASSNSVGTTFKATGNGTGSGTAAETNKYPNEQNLSGPSRLIFGTGLDATVSGTYGQEITITATGGGGSAPLNEIVYGTGPGLTSSPDFYFDETNGIFSLNQSATYASPSDTSIYAASATPASNSSGGAMNISAGTGDGTGAGGPISLYAGDGSTGGLVDILSGNSSNGIGGALNITSGNGAGVNAGGVITILGGTGGTGAGTGQGGTINITGGPADDTGGGGAVILTGGLSPAGPGGGVGITGGTSTDTGNGGSVDIGGGNADAPTAGYQGGTLDIYGGSSASDSGGNVFIAGGGGGYLSLIGAGGSVLIDGGTGNNGGSGGVLTLTSGGSDTGSNGDISLNGGLISSIPNFTPAYILIEQTDGTYGTGLYTEGSSLAGTGAAAAFASGHDIIGGTINDSVSAGSVTFGDITIRGSRADSATVPSGGNIVFQTGSSISTIVTIDWRGNVVVGAGVVTTATDGFIYVPTTTGTPTGVPTAFTGTVPMVVDTSGTGTLWFYIAGTWRSAALT